MGRLSLLEIGELSAGYGDITVLRGISMEVGEGETVGLFGPNGHGKTTLLRRISGLLVPGSGTVRFGDADISTAAPSRVVMAGLAHAPQGNTLFGEMRVDETLEMAAFTARARRRKAEGLAFVLDLFPRLRERARQRACTLSGGERQMLSVGVALMCAPKLLMLDEPTLGLSPRLKRDLGAGIAQISASGIALLIVEQDVEFLLGAAQRLYLMESGTIKQEIARRDAPDHAEIMRIYFGKDEA